MANSYPPLAASSKAARLRAPNAQKLLAAGSVQGQGLPDAVRAHAPCDQFASSAISSKARAMT